MEHHVILLNGPSKSGKDTVVSRLIPYLKFKHLKFADPLKDRLCAVLGCSRAELEQIKDQPHKLLRKKDSLDCYTPREELIYDSEQHWKPRYGDDIFGRILAHKVRNSPDQLVIASDCGFEDEIGRVVAEVGRHNVRVVRLHRSGFTFQGDSRGYVEGCGAKCHDIHNDAGTHELTMAVLRVIIREFPKYRYLLLREPEWVR